MSTETPAFVAVSRWDARDGFGLYRVTKARGTTGYYVEWIRGEEAYLNGGRGKSKWIEANNTLPMRDEADFDQFVAAWRAAKQAAGVLAAKHERAWDEHDRQYALVSTRWGCPVPRA